MNAASLVVGVLSASLWASASALAQTAPQTPVQTPIPAPPSSLEGAQPASPQAPTPPSPAAKPARGGALLPGGDARQPVLVDADKLEWFDRERKAVYSGSVLAQQGESSLKASRLTIFMTEQGKSAKSDLSRPTAGESASPTPGQGEIERMEADGPVELIQKDQTATGDKGEYDHAANTVTLIGHVTLRQGGNVTTGTRLVYDIDTRQAQVSNPKGMFAPRAAQPEASGAPLAQPAR